MALVRCKQHGRIWDDTKDEGCPLCLQEASMPRAPGAQPAKTTSPDEAAAKGRQLMLMILLVLLLIGGGIYFYLQSNNPVDAAQAARDSLRAVAAGPPRVDTTRFANPTDFTPIRRARALRTALSGLLSTNRATIMGMAEGPIDTSVTDRAAKRLAQQRLAFVNRWHARIDAAVGSGADFRYAPNTRMGPQMESVTNYLGAALSVMRDMVPRDHVKPRAERMADAQAVTGYLNSAGSVLTNMPR